MLTCLHSSAALNYCYVASGQLDLYWEIGCWAWDVCAGVVIAREAGGRCYGRGGKLMDDQDTKDLMCASPRHPVVCDWMLKLTSTVTGAITSLSCAPSHQKMASPRRTHRTASCASECSISPFAIPAD